MTKTTLRPDRGVGQDCNTETTGSTAAEALKLIELGMSPLPVPYGEKRPIITGWPALRIGKNDVADHFNSSRQNIGVILGVNGVADIDLDCPEAIAAAGGLMPTTQFIFGRDSTPRTHRLYWLDSGIKSVRFTDPVDRTVLVELRCEKSDGGVGLQTIVPPSMHPSGERIRYDSCGCPAKVKAADLLLATKDLAAVALLARHFPAEKSGRNEVFLALSGTLSRNGLPLERAIRIHQGLYRILWKGCPDLDQAEREVRATYQKFNAGQTVTGFTRLAELLPEPAVRRALEWLGASGGGRETASLAKVPFTDLGNAQRLIRRHGQDICWCEDWRSWLVFDGRCWARDNKQAVRAFAHETVRAMYEEAAHILDSNERKALADHARRSENRPRIEAMISEARPMRACTPAQFDQGSWLLNVANGTIDLRTAELGHHRREDLITRVIEINYDPDAKCPRFKRFLKEVFKRHPDIVPFIQKATGYSLTGVTTEECIFLLHGTGRNGKGTFIKSIAGILSDYAGTADFKTFASRGVDRGPRDDVANMRGKRFIAAQESHEGAGLAESLIKWLTGGDRVSARRLYENSFEFEPTHKIWLATNHKPRIRGADDGIWSRIKLIPFEVSFEGREDKGLKEELKNELPGILAWAVRGCSRWQEIGLRFPESVRNATAEYRSESDQVGLFLAAECDLDAPPTSRVRASALFSAYKAWCDRNGEEKMTGTAFGLRLTERRLPKKSTSKGVVYIGITLKSEV